MKKEKEKKKFTWLGHFCSFAMFHMDGLWILDLSSEWESSPLLASWMVKMVHQQKNF